MRIWEDCGVLMCMQAGSLTPRGRLRSGMRFSIKGLETLFKFTLNTRMSQTLKKYFDSVQFPMFGKGGNRGC